MTTKDKDKLAQIYRELPIAELICVALGSHTDEAVEIAGDILVERQKEVISFFQKMEPFELFSNIALPDFTKYNPAAFIGIKQVFSERKREMLEQLGIWDELFKTNEETMREMEEALQCNVEYPSEKQRYEVTLASIEEKKGWFANRIRRHIKHKLEKGTTKPPKKLDKDALRFLEEEVERYKKRVASWNEEIRPMILELLKINTTKTD